MKNLAFLKEDCPFYPIFERGAAPIKNWMLPSKALLVDSPETDVYMLDWDKCSEQQRRDIAKLVTQLRGGAPGDFLAYMEAGNDLPIRASQVSGVSSDCAAFL